MPVRLRPPVPVFVGVAQRDESAGFRNPRPLVRFQPLTPFIDFRGLGKRLNPLGLGPRESRFESEVPDQVQVLWGSQVARQLAVTQSMRRFESCPHSQICRGRFLAESLCPTNRCSRVRSSTPVPRRARITFARLTQRQGTVLITQVSLVRLQERAPESVCACGRADLCAPFLPETTGVRFLPGAPSRGRSMAGRWILVPTTSVRFTPSRPRFVAVSFNGRMASL